MESEHLATNEKVVGSNPSVFTIFLQFFPLSKCRATSQPRCLTTDH